MGGLRAVMYLNRRLDLPLKYLNPRGYIDGEAPCNGGARDGGATEEARDGGTGEP